MSFSHPFCRDCNNNLFVRHHFKRSKKNQWFADNIGDKLYNLFTTFEGAAKAALQKFAPILLDDPFFAVGAVLVISAGVAGPMVLYRYILAKYKLTQFIFGIKRQQAASDRLPAA